MMPLATLAPNELVAIVASNLVGCACCVPGLSLAAPPQPASVAAATAQRVSQYWRRGALFSEMFMSCLLSILLW
jgi:hypothetical protein